MAMWLWAGPEEVYFTPHGVWSEEEEERRRRIVVGVYWDGFSKDLERQVNSLSRGFEQASTPSLEYCSAAEWTIPLFSGSLPMCSIFHAPRSLVPPWGGGGIVTKTYKRYRRRRRPLLLLLKNRVLTRLVSKRHSRKRRRRERRRGRAPGGPNGQFS